MLLRIRAVRVVSRLTYGPRNNFNGFLKTFVSVKADWAVCFVDAGQLFIDLDLSFTSVFK